MPCPSKPNSGSVGTDAGFCHRKSERLSMAFKPSVLCVVLSTLIGTALPINALSNKPQEQAKPESKTNRYNVLFIAVDDLRPELG
jgi:hypothetical protein